MTEPVAAPEGPMDYDVDLPTFHGPLDLLLFLVKRNEVEIADIPIVAITDQFIAHLDRGERIDIEHTGEFVVMAATLMEIKSRSALPHEAVEAEEQDDPRRQLVRQLQEYKELKDAAGLLDARAEEQLRLMPRQPPAPRPADAPLQPVFLWDLVTAFTRLMRETLALQPRQIVTDETPQRVYMEQIMRRVATEGRLRFADLFTPPRHRARLVGMFLAILELMRGHRLLVEQAGFGDIWVAPGPDSTPNSHPPESSGPESSGPESSGPESSGPGTSDPGLPNDVAAGEKDSDKVVAIEAGGRHHTGHSHPEPGSPEPGIATDGPGLVSDPPTGPE